VVAIGEFLVENWGLFLMEKKLYWKEDYVKEGAKCIPI